MISEEWQCLATRSVASYNPRCSNAYLSLQISRKAQQGLLIGDVEGMFSKVGKGIPLAWKVEAEVEDLI